MPRGPGKKPRTLLAGRIVLQPDLDPLDQHVHELPRLEVCMTLVAAFWEGVDFFLRRDDLFEELFGVAVLGDQVLLACEHEDGVGEAGEAETTRGFFS